MQFEFCFPFQQTLGLKVHTVWLRNSFTVIVPWHLCPQWNFTTPLLLFVPLLGFKGNVLHPAVPSCVEPGCHDDTPTCLAQGRLRGDWVVSVVPHCPLTQGNNINNLGQCIHYSKCNSASVSDLLEVTFFTKSISGILSTVDVLSIVDVMYLSLS